MAYSIQHQFFNACKNGDTQEALRLLRKTGKRADPKAATIGRFTALMLATQWGNLDCVKALIAYSDAKYATIDGYTALMLAAQGGNLDCVKVLIPYSDAKYATIGGYTALMLSALHGYAEIAKILLPYSNVKASTSNGDTALAFAEEYGFTEMASLIRQRILVDDEREELVGLIAAPAQARQRSRSL